MSDEFETATYRPDPITVFTGLSALGLVIFIAGSDGGPYDSMPLLVVRFGIFLWWGGVALGFLYLVSSAIVRGESNR